MCIFGCMITIIEHQGKKLVSSLEVYKRAGYSPNHHTRWLRDFISTAQKNTDYFDITEKAHQDNFFPKNWHHNSKIKQELYFLTIEMAISACLIAKTESAKKLKLFLQLHK